MSSDLEWCNQCGYGIISVSFELDLAKCLSPLTLRNGTNPARRTEMSDFSGNAGVGVMTDRKDANECAGKMSKQKSAA